MLHSAGGITPPRQYAENQYIIPNYRKQIFYVDLRSQAVRSAFFKSQGTVRKIWRR